MKLIGVKGVLIKDGQVLLLQRLRRARPGSRVPGELAKGLANRSNREEGVAPATSTNDSGGAADHGSAQPKPASLGEPSGGLQHWDLPGGYIEGNEDPTAALLREVAEELPGSRNVQIGRLLSHYELRPPRQGRVEVYVVSAEMDATELSHEHVGHLWVSAAEFRRLAKTHPEWHLPSGYADAVALALQPAR